MQLACERKKHCSVCGFILLLTVADAAASEGKCGGVRAAPVSAGGGRGRRLFAASIVLRQQLVGPVR